MWKQAVPRFVARAIRNLSFSVSKLRYCGTRIRTHITTFLQHNITPAQRPERFWNLTARDSTKGWCFCLIFWTNLKMKFVRWASYCIYFVFCIDLCFAVVMKCCYFIYVYNTACIIGDFLFLFMIAMIWVNTFIENPFEPCTISSRIASLASVLC